MSRFWIQASSRVHLPTSWSNYCLNFSTTALSGIMLDNYSTDRHSSYARLWTPLPSLKGLLNNVCCTKSRPMFDRNSLMWVFSSNTPWFKAGKADILLSFTSSSSESWLSFSSNDSYPGISTCLSISPLRNSPLYLSISELFIDLFSYILSN